MKTGAFRQMEEALDLAVEAGTMACFTICRADGQSRYHVSRRAAAGLFKILARAEKLADYETGAVRHGYGARIEYQDCLQMVVLGVYACKETIPFLRGLAHYCKRKYKDAVRKVRAKERELAAAKEGGLVL